MTLPVEFPAQVTPSTLTGRATAPPAMSVAVSGASGLVGSALVDSLQANGRQVLRLVREGSETHDTALPQVLWDPTGGQVDAAALEGVDAVVHLAGESIAAGRWTAERRRRIRQSRALGTHALARAIAGLRKRPQVLVCASAIGFYGDRGGNLVDEESFAGKGFLAEVCQAWEEAAQPAAEAGVRVVNLRLGVVLSRQGGALAKMLTPFRLGLGGRVGSGQQWWSWVALDDVVGAIEHALACDRLRGPVNVVAPQPVTNRAFTKTLGKVLRRPTIMPLPAFAARLMLGQMADELLLASARVVPSRLIQTGYGFRFPHLEPALRHALGRS